LRARFDYAERQAFTGSNQIWARGASLVAIVYPADLRLRRRRLEAVLAGVLFGVGMAIAASTSMAWLFPLKRAASKTI